MEKSSIIVLLANTVRCYPLVSVSCTTLICEPSNIITSSKVDSSSLRSKSINTIFKSVAINFYHGYKERKTMHLT